MFMLMLFMFCFLLAFIAMFFYMLKKMNSIAKIHSDESAQLRVLLRAVEARLDKLAQKDRIDALLKGKIPTEEGDIPVDIQDNQAGHDPLLHLSFEQPSPLASPINPGLDLSMDESRPWEMPGTHKPE